MLREVVVVVAAADDDDKNGADWPVEEAIKLAMVRLDTAAEGLGSDAVQRMLSIAVATIFMVELKIR